MRTTKALTACAVMVWGALLAGAGVAEEVEFTLDGRMSFRDGTGLYVVTGVPVGGRLGGRYVQMAKTVPDSAAMTSRIAYPGKAEGQASLSACSNGVRYVARVRCVSKSGEKTGGCGLALLLPQSVWDRCVWRADDGTCGSLTGDFRRVRCSLGRLSSISIRRSDGYCLNLAFDRPVRLVTQGRKVYFRPNCELRFTAADAGRFAKGSESELSCVITSDGEIVPKGAPYSKVAAGAEWVPFDYQKDILPGSALDFTSLGLVDAPAGKHGRVVVRDGHFSFERRPDARLRFYGVNFCSTANCPPKDVTDALVVRLRRLGYNSIRIHHHERRLVKTDGLTPKADAVDRFDYLVARAVENGLYLTTDLYVSRPVAWRALGIEKDGQLTSAQFKRLVLLGHEPAIENLKAFSRWFLTRVNPYTGRALVDEPALLSIVLLNEAHLTKGWSEFGNIPSVRERWEEWTSVHGSTEASAHAFAVRREMETERDLKAFLRELGYGGLVSGDNNAPYYVAGRAKVGELYDYVDRHAYIDHPSFPGQPWQLPVNYENGNALFYPAGYMGATGCARAFGVPFTVSEWNYSGASPYRSMSGLMTGALAGVQDWDALWRFAYSHSSDDLPTGCGTSQGFNLAGDALLQAADRVATLLFLRRDIETARPAVALALPERNRLLEQPPVLIDTPWTSRSIWNARIGTAFAEQTLPDVRRVPLAAWTASEPPADLDFVSGPVTVDARTRGATVVTERTCGGFLEAGTAASAGPLAFSVRGHHATVSASALDGKPLVASKRVLVMHLTDVSNAGMVYLGKNRNYVLARGAKDAKQMMHRGVAEISLAVASADRFRVWALDTSGRRVREVPIRLADGRLGFTAEVTDGAAEMYYEVAAGAADEPRDRDASALDQPR